MCPPACWMLATSIGVLLGAAMVLLAVWMVTPFTVFPPTPSGEPRCHVTVYAANGVIVGTLFVSPSPYHRNAVSFSWMPHEGLDGYVRVNDVQAALEMAPHLARTSPDGGVL